MDTYVAHSTDATGLKTTYAPAAELLDAACGAGFVDVGEFGGQKSGAVGLGDARTVVFFTMFTLAVVALTS